MTEHIDHDQPIEAEDDHDTGSSLGSSIATSTQSLNSQLLQFEIEHGRRFHAYRPGSYAFPNDEDELDRMDFENQIFLLLFDGKLHFAPLTTPQNILDLGTGTGIWAIDMADAYPSAHVVGLDLSPVQTTIVPPNLTFEIDDFELDWTFQKNKFDLIHWRLLLGSVADYPKLFRQSFEHIKPGGYMEIHEIDPGFYSDDDSIPPGSSAVQWSDCFNEACRGLGRTLPPIEGYKDLMRDAGFVDIVEIPMKRPSNIWPKNKTLKRIGMYTLTNHMEGLHAFTIGTFTRGLGWSPTEVEILIAKCRTEWNDPTIHGYQRVIALYGRKPPLESTV